jgi:hypothetical protein
MGAWVWVIANLRSRCRGGRKLCYDMMIVHLLLRILNTMALPTRLITMRSTSSRDIEEMKKHPMLHLTLAYFRKQPSF